MEYTVYLALGSNIHDKKKNIEKACEALSKKVRDIQIANIYETKPWGYAYQENFLNTVVKGITDLSPFELLIFTQSIEKEVGRVKRFKNGPREVDIDILFYGNEIIETDILTIPHPRIQERDFVLQPLADFDNGYMHPKLKVSWRSLLENLKGERYIISSSLRQSSKPKSKPSNHK